MQIINASTNNLYCWLEGYMDPFLLGPLQQLTIEPYTNTIQYLDTYYPDLGYSSTLTVGQGDIVSMSPEFVSVIPMPVPGSQYPQVWWDGVLLGLPLAAALMAYLAIRRAFSIGDSCAD